MVPDEERDEPRGLLRRRRRRPVDAAGLTGSEARARAAWDDLCNSSMLRRGGGQLLVMDGPGDTAGICPLRPLVQVLAARLDLDRLGPVPRPTNPVSPSLDDLADTLERYRWGDGYADYPGTDTVSSDDNAAVALAALQAHAQLLPPTADSLWLHRAKRTFEVVTGGPRRAEVAGQLFLATGIERYADLSEPVAGSAAGDQPSSTDSGGSESAAIGAALTRWKVTGDRLWLDRAVELGASTLDWMTVDHQLWGDPPADVAERFRVLLRVHATEPRPRVLAELDRYLERVWREGRDPATGRFDAGGIGRSPDRGATLDHGGIVELFALQAHPLEG